MYCCASSCSLAAYSLQAAHPASDDSHLLTAASKNLFSSLTRSAQPVGPMEFILCLRKKFPQFAQQGREGHYMQQDAEECWTNLMYTLREKLMVRVTGAVIYHEVTFASILSRQSDQRASRKTVFLSSWPTFCFAHCMEVSSVLKSLAKVTSVSGVSGVDYWAVNGNCPASAISGLMAAAGSRTNRREHHQKALWDWLSHQAE